MIRNFTATLTLSLLTIPAGDHHSVSPARALDPKVSEVSSGALDTSFGDSGIITTTFSGTKDSADAMVLQADGKTVVVGGSANGHGRDTSFMIARYAQEGVLDDTFGSGGKVTVNVGAANRASATAVALQNDGKIIVGGFAFRDANNRDVALIRLTSDGRLDETFDGDGRVITSAGPRSSEAQSVKVQQDGKILVAAWAEDANFFYTSRYNSAVIRYTTHGNLDATFSGGTVTHSFGDTTHTVDLGLGPDGKILVAGHTTMVTRGVVIKEQTYLMVYRLTKTGDLDESFGTSGVQLIDAGMSAGGRGLVVQDDGGLLVSGVTTLQNESRTSILVVARLSEAGVLDSDFGVGGVSSISIRNNGIQPWDLAVDSGGGIVVTGQDNPTNGSSSLSLAGLIVRLKSDGSLDKSFGVDGVSVVQSGTRDSLSSIVVRPNGRILLAGASENYERADSRDVLLAQVLQDGALDPSFGTAGITTTTAVGPVDDAGYGVALQRDGKIIIGGGRQGAFFASYVARFTRNGQLDPTFGLNGRVQPPYAVEGLTLNSSDSVITVGTEHTFSPESIVVQNIDGTGNILPRTFETTGRAGGITIQNNDRVVVAGSVTATSGRNLVLGRSYSIPQADSSFGVSGVVMTSIGPGDDAANAVVVASDGRIIVAGTTTINGQTDFAVVRYNTDGTLDTSFSGDGIVTTSIGPGDDLATSAAFDRDERLLVAGSTSNGETTDAAIISFNPDGSTYLGFGSSGMWTRSIGAQNDEVRALAIQDDNKVVVVGSSESGLDTRLFVTRIHAPSSKSQLTALTPSIGRLEGGFSPTVQTYGLTVSNEVTSFALTPTLAEKNATLSINGIQATSGRMSEQVPLIVGDNLIRIIVTAQDGVTQTTYEVTVTRQQSGVSALRSLTLSSGHMSPDFDPAITQYAATVENEVSSVRITAETLQPDSTIKVNDETVLSGRLSGAKVLTTGENTIEVTVTSQDQGSRTVYRVSVRRAKSRDTSLSSLSLQSGTDFLPIEVKNGFAAAAVPNKSRVVSLSVVPLQAGTTVSIDGEALDPERNVKDVSLEVGSNVFIVGITAEDGVTYRGILLEVTRDIGVLARGRTITVSGVLRTIDRSSSRGTTTRIEVNKRSSRICKSTKSGVKALSPGLCRLKVITTRRSTGARLNPKTQSTMVTLRVTK